MNPVIYNGIYEERSQKKTDTTSIKLFVCFILSCGAAIRIEVNLQDKHTDGTRHGILLRRLNMYSYIIYARSSL